MALNAKKAPKAGGKKQPTMEAGTYPARLVQIIDLGIQPQRPYKGEDKPPCHEIMFTYEFLDEFCKDDAGEDMEDKPRWISETFPFRNLEQDKATSTKRYYALDPDEVHEGDISKLIETPCMTTIVLNKGKGVNADKIYENISNVSTMRPKEAAKAKALVNPPKLFLLDQPDLTIFQSLPEWLQTKLKSNLEYKGSKLEKLLSGQPVASNGVIEGDIDESAEAEENW